MGTTGFLAAFSRGEPLVDVGVKFRAGVDCVTATKLLNSLADDFDLYPRPWYDDPQSRMGTATRAALLRMFGWRLKRAPLPSNEHFYWWKEVSPPNHFPKGLENAIESIGLSQPGADDDGQWYEYD